MTKVDDVRTEMMRIASAAGSVEQRSDALLARLRGIVPYAVAWVGVRDPETRVHRRVGSVGDTDPLVRYFALPEADQELEDLGLNRFQPPVPASALGVPLAETRAWGEFLMPAGLDDGVAVGLFGRDGRHLGFLAVMTGDPTHRIASNVALLTDLRPVFAHALDRLPSFAAAADLSSDAVGGVVLTRAGRSIGLPGLPPHPLLTEPSPVLAFARRCLTAPGAAAAFLAPHAQDFVRIRVVDFRDERVDHLTALVLVGPAGDALRLARADLQLLGALVEGWDDERIRAGTGWSDVGRRTSSLASALGLAGTTALVQHVAREGLFVPPPLWR